MTRTMRLAILLTFLALVFGIMSIVHGQGLGFELRGPVTFGGYTNERPIWTVGKGLQFIAVDPTLHKRLAELEGQRILITVERISPNK